jgi:hypothetical protein
MNELRNGNQKLEKEIEELKSEHATLYNRYRTIRRQRARST